MYSLLLFSINNNLHFKTHHPALRYAAGAPLLASEEGKSLLLLHLFPAHLFLVHHSLFICSLFIIPCSSFLVHLFPPSSTIQKYDFVNIVIFFPTYFYPLRNNRIDHFARIIGLDWKFSAKATIY